MHTFLHPSLCLDDLSSAIFALVPIKCMENECVATSFVVFNKDTEIPPLEEADLLLRSLNS